MASKEALAKVPPPPVYPHRLDTTTPLYPHVPDPLPLGGFRILLALTSAFPPLRLTGPTEFREPGGEPVYIGSAYIEKGETVMDVRGAFNPNSNGGGGTRWGLIPCKITPAITWPVRAPFAEREVHHRGKYELLPFIPEIMEWVPAKADGSLPEGRNFVEGGYEKVESANGAVTETKLYHARAEVEQSMVPGRTAEADKACYVAFGDDAVRKTTYDVL